MARRKVDAEERALWSRATRDVKPLKGRRAPALAPAEGAPAPGPAPAPRRKAPAAAPAPAPAPPRPPARGGLFAAGDPKIEWKARRGRIAVERAIDLHGLSQDAARRRLDRFIAEAAADGARCVLVITGKGRPQTARGPGRDEAPARGVLRERFLDWIEAPPLRGFIARAAKAAPRHGGDGAFYLFLKSRR